MPNKRKNNWVNWHEYMPNEEAENYDFGSTPIVEKFAFLLLNHAELMKKIPISLESKRLFLATPLALGISSNAIAIVKLAKESHGNEIYPIARSLIERLINLYYIQSCDEVELDNYIDYSKQKTFRKLNRSLTINDKRFSIKRIPDINLPEFPDLKAAVDKFTSLKKQKQITRWSKLSLEKKLSVIDHSGEINITLIMMALEVIYDDASEALHGTLYGCTFHLGAYDGEENKDAEEIIKKYRKNLTMIFFFLGYLLGDLNQYIFRKCDMNDLVELSDDINSQIKDTLKKCLEKHK
jgi:hypothetical protein